MNRYRSSCSSCAVAPFSIILGAMIACRSAPPPNVAATVNSHAIPYAELDKNIQSQSNVNPEGSSEDQAMIQRLEILRNLIDSEILLQRAEKMGLMAVDADVETKFNEMKAPYTKEEFQKLLQSRKMTLDDLKSQLRRDLSIQKLLNKEITSHITITDADVSNFYNLNKASFHFAEPQVHLAQIVVTPHPDPNVRNLKNDKARNPDEARRKVQAIEARLKQGEDFGMLAQNYSEDSNTAANGGDLGLVPESALEQASPEIKKVVIGLRPGEISPIIPAPDGYRILKLISKEPAGQRELTDPRVQQSVRETLLNRKDQLLKAAYYEVARNDAKVVNYLARSIIANAGQSQP